MDRRPIYPNVGISNVHLKVAGIQRSLQSYRDVLGFDVIQGCGLELLKTMGMWIWGFNRGVLS